MEQVILKLKHMKSFIIQTREYYHDGVDEELIMYIDDLLSLVSKLSK